MGTVENFLGTKHPLRTLRLDPWAPEQEHVQFPFPFFRFPLGLSSAGARDTHWPAARGQCEEETSPSPPASPPLSASRFRGCLTVTAPSPSFPAAPQPMLLQLPHIPVGQPHGLECWKLQQHITRTFQCFAKLNAKSASDESRLIEDGDL